MAKTGKWTRRFFIAAAVLVVVGLIGHGLWTYLAWRGVQSRVAALQAAGEPILPADFATQNPDAPDNAGPDIAAVGEQIRAYTDASKALDFDLELPLRPNEKQAIEHAVKELAPAIAQFDQARAKPRAEWKLDFQRPILVNMLGRMNGPRAVARLLCAAALLDHENHNDAQAMQRIDGVIFLSRYVDKHPSLVGHLVSIGCLALASSTAMELAPDLNASPQDFRRVIDQLLDDAPQREGLHRAFRGERMAQLDAVQSIIDGIPFKTGRDEITPPGSGNALVRYAFRPFFYHNERFMLDHMTGLIDVAQERDLPAAQARLTPKPRTSNPMYALSMILVPALERAVQTHYRLGSDRRLAATALAIRWYALDHNGQRPQKLADLVPQYLPAVPKDALLADAPLGYVPDPSKPILYSAGANGVDDGGNDALMRPMPDGSNPPRGGDWERLDRVVPLNRPPRLPPEPDPNAPPIPEESPATNPAPQ
jgi:hypothetical protein